jgi:RepB DNA-primase from phage plasmid
MSRMLGARQRRVDRGFADRQSIVGLSDPACRGTAYARCLRQVGASTFDLTHINIDGEKRGFRPAQTLGQLKNSVPYVLESAPKRQNNIIVRPHDATAQLIQLDDLKAEALGRVRNVSFLTLQTSPGNHQAWVAVSGLTSGEETQRIRPQTTERGRGRPFRVWRNACRRHDQLQTQIRTAFSDG